MRAVDVVAGKSSLEGRVTVMNKTPLLTTYHIGIEYLLRHLFAQNPRIRGSKDTRGYSISIFPVNVWIHPILSQRMRMHSHLNQTIPRGTYVQF